MSFAGIPTKKFKSNSSTTGMNVTSVSNAPLSQGNRKFPIPANAPTSIPGIFAIAATNKPMFLGRSPNMARKTSFSPLNMIPARFLSPVKISPPIDMKALRSSRPMNSAKSPTQSSRTVRMATSTTNTTLNAPTRMSFRMVGILFAKSPNALAKILGPSPSAQSKKLSKSPLKNPTMGFWSSPPFLPAALPLSLSLPKVSCSNLKSCSGKSFIKSKNSGRWSIR